VVEISPEALEDRRNHPNFLAKELRPELYQVSPSLMTSGSPLESSHA
jgi:hypothetical protein